MAMPPPMPGAQAFIVLCRQINQVSARNMMAAVTEAINEHKTHVHILLQSYGGFAADAVALYEFFRSLPTDFITLYNTGTIRSSAVTAYLGAERRLTTPDATFMIHRCTYQEPKLTGTAIYFGSIADGLVHDDLVVKTIIERRPMTARTVPSNRMLTGSGTRAGAPPAKSMRFIAKPKLDELVALIFANLILAAVMSLMPIKIALLSPAELPLPFSLNDPIRVLDASNTSRRAVKGPKKSDCV